MSENGGDSVLAGTRKKVMNNGGDGGDVDAVRDRERWR